MGYCFSNKMSTMTPKTVFFSMDVGQDPNTAPNVDSEEHHNKLSSMISVLSNGMYVIKHEQEYIEVRERTHRETNDSTNSRVAWWSFFEMLVLMVTSAGQIYYLKRFFEVRTVI